MIVTIYHNPRCSKSRQALRLLESKGIKPLIIDYMKTPPSLSELRGVLKLLGIKAGDLLRVKESAAKERGLTAQSDEADILNAMHEMPQLMERPIIITEKGACIARPPETLSEIL